jgi:hypothetical protein
VGACSLGFLIGVLARDTADSLLALALVGLGGIIGELLRRRQPQETSNP